MTKMITGNIRLLGTRVGRVPKKFRSSYLSGGTEKFFSSYDDKLSLRHFGVELIFENLNNYPVDLRLTFSKHISRNEDGTFLKDITPKEDPIRIPANEKIKSYVSLGEDYPISQNDLRLQDIYIETISVIKNGSVETKADVSMQIYDKNQVSQASTIFRQRLFQSVINLFFVFWFTALLGNDNSPFWFKAIFIIGAIYLLFKTYQIWQRPFIKFSKIASLWRGY